MIEFILLILFYLVVAYVRSRSAKKAKEAEAADPADALDTLEEQEEVITAPTRKPAPPNADPRQDRRNRRDQAEEDEYRTGSEIPSKPEAPSKSRNMGKDMLEQLAKELGLPLPEGKQTRPAPPPRPQAQMPSPARLESNLKTGKKPAQEKNWRESNYDDREGRLETRRKPVSSIAPQSQTVARTTAIPLPSLRGGDDVAAAMLLQAVLHEPPGLRAWKRKRGMPERLPKH